MKVSKMIKELKAKCETYGDNLELVLSADQDDVLGEISTEGVDFITSKRDSYSNGNDTPRLMIW